MDTTKLNLLLEAIDEINALEDEIAMLEESAGVNGYLKRRAQETIKSCDRDLAKLKEKRDQYERAGYGDVFDSKHSTHDIEKRKKDAIDELNRHRRYASGELGCRDYAKENREALHSDMCSSGDRVRNTVRKFKANERINKRAGLAESIEYANILLDILDEN